MMAKPLAERLKHFAKGQGFEPTVRNFVEYLRQSGVEVVGLPYNKHISEIGRKIGVTSPVMLARFVNTLVEV
jgi:2-oxoglutarate ferredoxin oxidoreductase subunit alpha